jgi:frataxin-like iron-binding protein CyaY
MKRNLFLGILLMMGVLSVTSAQPGLLGSWKYSSQGGVMTMQISAATIMINNQTFPYKAQGNVLMINEGDKITPYPYMLDGNQLSIEFPGGTSIVFNRSTADAPSQGQLPQSMSRPSAAGAQGQQSTSLSGKWVFSNQQGQLVLEFLSAGQLTFNGETTQYQLKEGIIQALGDAGWIDYPYTLSQGVLTITFPDGTKIPFSKDLTASNNPQGNVQQINNQQQGGGALWQLRGSYCSYSGSSNAYSSYSRTQKIVFDGQGHFQFGSETSFSGDAGLAYSGNPNIKGGTYSVSDRIVTLYYQDGTVYQFQVNMRQNNGMITELMYSGTLYATGLCE